jgi:two-component system KDP operon response regulator KdpE
VTVRVCVSWQVVRGVAAVTHPQPARAGRNHLYGYAPIGCDVTNYSSQRKRPLVLVVDDEPAVIRMMTLELKAQGFDVVGSQVGDDTFRTIDQYEPEVAVMEVVLPGVTGFELLGEIKRRYGLPVVFVTTQGNRGDRDYALSVGADDYITKPFSPSDLASRLRAVLPEGRETSRRDQLRLGDVEIDLGRRVVRRGGNEVVLTTNEWALLYALASQRGRQVSARDLLIEVWGGDYAADTHYLEAWIRRLREKLEPEPNAPRLLIGDAARGYALGRPNLRAMRPTA